MAKELPPRPGFPIKRPAAQDFQETPVQESIASPRSTLAPIPAPPVEFSRPGRLQNIELEEEYEEEGDFLGLSDSPFNNIGSPAPAPLGDNQTEFPQSFDAPAENHVATQEREPQQSPEPQQAVIARQERPEPQQSPGPQQFSGVSPEPQQPIPPTPHNLLAPTEEDELFLPPELQESVNRLLTLITDEDSSEVIINGPQEVMFKKNGARFQVPNINLGDGDTYHRILNEYVLCHADTQDRIGPDSFRVEGQLEIVDKGDNHPPLLARIHIIAPPVVKYSKVTIAKKSRVSFNLDDIASRGAMTTQMAEFLKICARGRITTVFSGLSGAGKTTMMEAFTKYFDPNDRVIVVEDTPELRVQISDTVYLQTRTPNPGEDPSREVSMEWLVKATNRMRPDRILVGEIMGAEMSEFLIAANSGADGSMTTLHAGDPRRTLDKILSLAMKSGDAKNEMSVRRDIASTVQMIVQMTLIDGKHIVSHIEEVSNIMRQDSGIISTSTIYEYDRSAGYHVVRNRPSDGFIRFLNQRGLNLDINLFKR